jgi:hypothetical protein
VTSTLPHDIAKLAQMTAQCVDQLGALTDQQVPGAEDHGRALRLRALRAHEPHGRPLRRLADRLGIGHVVLLALHERLHVRWRDQAGLMTQGGDLPGPVVGARTGFHRHNAPRLGGEERQHLVSSKLLPEIHRA